MSQPLLCPYVKFDNTVSLEEILSTPDNLDKFGTGY